MNVLSLFNGISAFHLALDRAGITHIFKCMQWVEA